MSTTNPRPGDKSQIFPTAPGPNAFHIVLAIYDYLNTDTAKAGFAVYEKMAAELLTRLPFAQAMEAISNALNALPEVRQTVHLKVLENIFTQIAKPETGLEDFVHNPRAKEQLGVLAAFDTHGIQLMVSPENRQIPEQVPEEIRTLIQQFVNLHLRQALKLSTTNHADQTLSESPETNSVSEINPRT